MGHGLFMDCETNRVGLDRQLIKNIIEWTISEGIINISIVLFNISGVCSLYVNELSCNVK